VSSNQWFGLGPAINYQTVVSGVHPQGVYLTDMRVYYDTGINRWMVVQRSLDEDIFGNPLNSSHLYLAVSQTADPTANYNIYVMNTTNGSHPGCPCIDDYPQIGADQYGFHIAWNEFNTSSEQFVDAAILTISKASLASGASVPTAVPAAIRYRLRIRDSTGNHTAGSKQLRGQWRPGILRQFVVLIRGRQPGYAVGHVQYQLAGYFKSHLGSDSNHCPHSGLRFSGRCDTTCRPDALRVQPDASRAA
jgi:hypothetical protein